MSNSFLLFSGSSNRNLAQAVASELKCELGRMHLGQFPDGETEVQILEDVRSKDVFILQTIGIDPNRLLCELLIIIDALKRAFAKSITAVIPYLGYCRQDRKNKEGVPITAKLVANLLHCAGINRVITLDLHADQVEGFFEIPVIHLHCQLLLADAVNHLFDSPRIVVAPDIGSIKLAESMAKFLGTGLAIVKKERLGPFDVNMTLIGDVNDQNVLIVDDMCTTAGTIVASARLCQSLGAKKIIAAVTHGLFVGDAAVKIDASPIDHFFVTDTLASTAQLPKAIATVSVAPMIAETILKIS